MNTREAFDAIQRKLRGSAGTSVLDAFFDENVFGNFWITYERDSGRSSVVNDRGQLILNSGPADGQLARVLLDDLYSADATTVLDSLS